jgi:hypothetical protein
MCSLSIPHAASSHNSHQTLSISPTNSSSPVKESLLSQGTIEETTVASTEPEVEPPAVPAAEVDKAKEDSDEIEPTPAVDKE